LSEAEPEPVITPGAQQGCWHALPDNQSAARGEVTFSERHWSAPRPGTGSRPAQLEHGLLPGGLSDPDQPVTVSPVVATSMSASSS
jgi:hypothetical protein